MIERLVAALRRLRLLSPGAVAGLRKLHDARAAHHFGRDGRDLIHLAYGSLLGSSRHSGLTNGSLLALHGSCCARRPGESSEPARATTEPTRDSGERSGLSKRIRSGEGIASATGYRTGQPSETGELIGIASQSACGSGKRPGLSKRTRSGENVGATSSSSCARSGCGSCGSCATATAQRSGRGCARDLTGTDRLYHVPHETAALLFALFRLRDWLDGLHVLRASRCGDSRCHRARVRSKGLKVGARRNRRHLQLQLLAG
jgi:hypothetical protein